MGARQNIARLFFDLRQALRLTPHHLAAHLMTVPQSIYALERGEFELMPDWSETCRIVIAYTNLAGIDGRPVLAAMSNVVRETAARPQVSGNAYAAGLPRLPQPQGDFAAAEAVERDAYDRDFGGRGGMETGLPAAQGQLYGQVYEQAYEDAGDAYGQRGGQHGGQNEGQNAAVAGSKGRRLIGKVKVRPDRVFYALSLPLALLLLLLNTSILRTVVSYLPRPAAEIVRDLRTYVQVRFAPVYDGFRWIEVSNPRDRRGDKLPIRRQSD